MKFSIKYLFNNCNQTRRELRIWSHLLKKSLLENFIFCAVCCSSTEQLELKKLIQYLLWTVDGCLVKPVQDRLCQRYYYIKDTEIYLVRWVHNKNNATAIICMHRNVLAPPKYLDAQRIRPLSLNIRSLSPNAFFIFSLILSSPCQGERVYILCWTKKNRWSKLTFKITEFFSFTLRGVSEIQSNIWDGALCKNSQLIFTTKSVLDVWQSFEYAFGTCGNFYF